MLDSGKYTEKRERKEGKRVCLSACVIVRMEECVCVMRCEWVMCYRVFQQNGDSFILGAVLKAARDFRITIFCGVLYANAKHKSGVD